MRKRINELYTFYSKRQDNFRNLNRYYFKGRGSNSYLDSSETDISEEPLTPINLLTHMINMAVSMSTQEAPSMEVLVDETKKQEATRGEKAEKVFAGVLQMNAETQERDLLHDYFHNLYLYGWGVWSVLFDDNRVPASHKSSILKAIEQREPSSPDALSWPSELPDDSMPIVVEVPHPGSIYPLPGGSRGRWRAIFREWEMTLVEAEDFFGLELPRSTPETDPKRSEEDDHVITCWDVWAWVGNAVWHCIIALNLPRYAQDEKFQEIWQFKDDEGYAYIKNPTEMPEYSRLPYEIRFCFPTTDHYGEHFGLSLLYAAVDAVMAAERIVSRHEMILDMNADPTKVRETNSEIAGGPDFPVITGIPGETVDVDKGKGQDFKYVQWQGSPPDIKILVEFWMQMAKEYGFDPQIEGTTGLDTIVKKSGILAKLIIPLTQSEAGLAALHSRIMHLFKLIKKPLTVKGKQVKNDQMQAYSLEVSGNDLKGCENARFRIKARFPHDELQNAAIVKTLTDGDNPLLSLDTGRTRYLNVDDAVLEQRKIDKQKVNNNPAWNLLVEAVANQLASVINPPPPPELEEEAPPPMGVQPPDSPMPEGAAVPDAQMQAQALVSGLTQGGTSDPAMALINSGMQLPADGSTGQRGRPPLG